MSDKIWKIRHGTPEGRAYQQHVQDIISETIAKHSYDEMSKVYHDLSAHGVAMVLQTDEDILKRVEPWGISPSSLEVNTLELLREFEKRAHAAVMKDIDSITSKKHWYDDKWMKLDEQHILSKERRDNERAQLLAWLTPGHGDTFYQPPTATTHD